MRQQVHIILPETTWTVTLNLGDTVTVADWSTAPTERPGIGSVVAATTQAVGIKPCGGCLKRKSALNRATPNWLRRLAQKLGRFLMQW